MFSDNLISSDYSTRSENEMANYQTDDNTNYFQPYPFISKFFIMNKEESSQ